MEHSATSFENTGWRNPGQFKSHRFRHSSMERGNPGLTWMSPEHPVDLDAGNPCRHDEDLHFSCSVGERKIMNNFVESRSKKTQKMSASALD
jgi:hypothetical protein